MTLRGYDAERVGALDAAALAPAVRRVLGRDGATPTAWQARSVEASIGVALGNAGLYRLAGEARDGDATAPWRLVLKTFRPMPTSDDPVADNYWRREALAYGSGLLEDLPGIAAPRCAGVVEHADGGIWVWMEEVSEEGGAVWDLDDYARAARHLGRFNGAYLAGRPIPDRPWLGGAYLRSWVERFAPLFAALPAARQDPRLRPFWPDDLAEGLTALLAGREELYRALGRLPQTLAHGDATRRNLFARRRPDGVDETVVIDWMFLGRWAVGEEVAQLVVVPALFFDTDVARLDELDGALFEAYLVGLREAGWHGDARLARLGYCLHAALRNACLGSGLTWPDEARRAAMARVFGRPYEEGLENLTRGRRFMLARAAEARALMGELGL